MSRQAPARDPAPDKLDKLKHATGDRRTRGCGPHIRSPNTSACRPTPFAGWSVKGDCPRTAWAGC